MAAPVARLLNEATRLQRAQDAVDIDPAHGADPGGPGFRLRKRLDRGAGGPRHARPARGRRRPRPRGGGGGAGAGGGGAAAGGGGGGTLTPNISVSTLSLCAPGVGKGLVQFTPLDGVPVYQTIGLQAWGDETSDEYQITVNDIAGYVDYVGCKGILVSDALTTTNNPFGVVEGVGDGVKIYGADATGKTTQVWMEAHNGANEVKCVSSMTDSAKTGTLDFNAFLSTMASVYPEIVKPYS